MFHVSEPVFFFLFFASTCHLTEDTFLITALLCFCVPGLPLLISLILHPRVKTKSDALMYAACLLVCLTSVGATVVKKDQVAQQTNKLYQSKDATHDQSWVLGNCKRLTRLLHQKNVVVKKLAAAADAVRQDQGLPEAERHFQVGEKTVKLAAVT